jgi:DNA repair exonuclease SbcCD ATPase subunit
VKQTSKAARKPQTGLTFEDVWAMFQETDKQFKETDKRLQETDRLIKEIAKQSKKTDKQIGELGNKFGAVIEHMMIPNLKEKFNALGYEFGKVSTNVLIETKEEGTIAEIDIFLENGDCAIVHYRTIRRHC